FAVGGAAAGRARRGGPRRCPYATLTGSAAGGGGRRSGTGGCPALRTGRGRLVGLGRLVLVPGVLGLGRATEVCADVRVLLQAGVQRIDTVARGGDRGGPGGFEQLTAHRFGDLREFR